MEKRAFFGNQVISNSYGFRGFVITAVAGWMGLLGPVVEKIYAEDKDPLLEAILIKIKEKKQASAESSKEEHPFWQRRRSHWKGTKLPEYYQPAEGLPSSSPSRFLRGDVNQDGQVNIQDATVLLNLIYNDEYEPSCLESADVNNDGKILLGDAIQIINYSACGMIPPANPFPSCGMDADSVGTQKNLGCDFYDACVSATEDQEEDQLDRIRAIVEEDEEDEADEEDEEDDEAEGE